MSKEIDFATKRHQIEMDQNAESRTKVLDDKLKPKGHLLLDFIKK